MRRIFLTLSTIGFIFCNGHFTLGINYNQTVDASFSNWGEWDEGSIYYDFLPSPPLTYFKVNQYKLINDILLGYYYSDLFGKNNKIDLYFELLFNSKDKSELLDYSQFDYGMLWRFIDFSNIDIFIKIGISEILNFEINGNSLPGMKSSSNAPNYGLGFLYKKKIKLSYDIINYNISKSSPFYQSEPIDKIGYMYNFDIKRFNLSYIF
tara:strand:- start:748 stop:1371 length:624 start_codon:yes stop_codon:yes gene_type:complete